MTEEQKDVARELRRVRDEVRRKAAPEGEPTIKLPPPPEVREPQPIPKDELPAPEPPPTPPDSVRVNELWRAEPRTLRGIAGFLFRVLDRLLQPRFEAQQAFNAQQVQLDNDILSYLEKRSAATHRHYDRTLGIYGRHIEEIDERHRILSEELVSHVEDLLRRIDLVLDRAERGRLSIEHELRDLRRQLERLQSSLSGS